MGLSAKFVYRPKPVLSNPPKLSSWLGSVNPEEPNSVIPKGIVKDVPPLEYYSLTPTGAITLVCYLLEKVGTMAILPSDYKAFVTGLLGKRFKPC